MHKKTDCEEILSKFKKLKKESKSSQPKTNLQGTQGGLYFLKISDIEKRKQTTTTAET